MKTVDYQRTPGRREPCCWQLKWAVQCSYIKKGYMWWQNHEPVWIPWTLSISGKGYRDVSPIAFCPFCGKSLDKPED